MTLIKNFSENFKQNIVNLHDAGKSVSELSAEYNISHTSIYNWIKLYSKVSKKTFSDAQIYEIQNENIRLKKEIDILKKAIAIVTNKDIITQEKL